MSEPIHDDELAAAWGGLFDELAVASARGRYGSLTVATRLFPKIRRDTIRRERCSKTVNECLP